VSVPAAVLHDAAGNSNVASNSLSVVFDFTRPTVTLSTAASSINTSSIDVTAVFSKPVTGFTAAGVATSATFVTITNVRGSGSVYTFTVADIYLPTLPPTYPLDISIKQDAAHDAAGNGNPSSATLHLIIDNQPPTITLSSATPSPTNQSSVIVTATFSEP